MSKPPQDLKRVLANLRKASKMLDGKIDEAIKIKNLLADTLEVTSMKYERAILSANLFLMKNAILSLEANRIQLRQQILRIVAVCQSQKKKV